MTTDLLKQLRETAEFRNIMGDMEKLRPVVPEFKVGATLEATALLVERVKEASAERRGFDRLYQHLTGHAPQEGV